MDLFIDQTKTSDDILAQLDPVENKSMSSDDLLSELDSLSPNQAGDSYQDSKMDWYLDINGISRHEKDPDEVMGQSAAEKIGNKWNERNYGIGVTAKDGNTFYTAGGYKNSLYEPSFYAGAGLSKRFGNDFYIEPGVMAGLVTGYENPVTPFVMPQLSVGLKDFGALNLRYAPEYENNPAFWTMNLSVPIE